MSARDRWPPRGFHRAVAVASLAAPCLVLGHGGLTRPLPRNSFNHSLSLPLWQSPLHSASPSARASMTMWTNYFDDGCNVGCDACSHHRPNQSQPSENHRSGYWPPSSVDCKVNGTSVSPGSMSVHLPGSNTLPDYARTWNMDGASGLLNISPRGDWGRFNPWRAPGAAPILSPCGLLCPNCTNPGNVTPADGRELPPLSSPPATWAAGETAEVAWALAVNHGGGYQYRLCKKIPGKRVTEACFQATPLVFASKNTTVRMFLSKGSPITGSNNGSTIVIPAVDVSGDAVTPRGSIWRRNPIPACGCDGGGGCARGTQQHPGTGTCVSHCGTNSTDCWCNDQCIYHQDCCSDYTAVCHGMPTPDWIRDFNTPYSNRTDGPPGCPEGLMFPPPWPEGYGFESGRAAEVGAHPSKTSPLFNYELVDTVRVPSERGEYALSWRWDVEQNPQVWSGCSDVKIT